MTSPARCRGTPDRECDVLLHSGATRCLDCTRALRVKQMRRLREHPGHRALRQVLSALTISADSSNAFVLDARSKVLCHARLDPDEAAKQVRSVCASALRALNPALARGGKLERVWRLHIDAYLHSFDSAYVLFVLFPGAFDPEQAREAVLADLPAISELTSKLPPSGGSGPSAGEAFGVG